MLISQRSGLCVENRVFAFLAPWLQTARSNSRRTYAQAREEGGGANWTSGLQPSARCLPLGCWQSSTSELIIDLTHTHTHFHRCVCQYVNTQSQHPLAVLDAHRGVFRSDHLLESQLTGVGAALLSPPSPGWDEESRVWKFTPTQQVM